MGFRAYGVYRVCRVYRVYRVYLGFIGLMRFTGVLGFVGFMVLVKQESQRAFKNAAKDHEHVLSMTTQALYTPPRTLINIIFSISSWVLYKQKHKQ